MLHDIQLKVCGLTSAEDANAAVAAGADALGFIFHPASPRMLPLEKYRGIKSGLPSLPKVAVVVEPSVGQLNALQAEGFAFFQVHVRLETPVPDVVAWSRAVGREKLWLAPKLPPGTDVPPELLPWADTFLLDTFDPVKFGGTGKTGDWGKFARHRAAHPGKTWILSGGLTPDNLSEAVRATGARYVDVNSGVESRPGIKDREKLNRLKAVRF